MNWFDAHPAIPPFLLGVITQITLVLAVALIAQACFIRSAALRHAILLIAFLAIPATPIFAIFIKSLQHKTVLPQFLIHTGLPLSTPIASTFFYFSTFQGAPLAREFPWAAAIGAIWFSITLFLLIRCVIGIRTVRRIAAHAHDVSASIPAPIQSELLALFVRMPPILESPALTVPIAAGIYSPAIILPAGLISRVDPPTLLQILIHESAHALRRDPLAGLYQRVLSALLWFHPLLHLANHRLSTAREEICDNYVLTRTTPPDYARTLLHLAQSMLPAKETLLSPTLLRSPSSLKKRIARLLNRRRSIMTDLGFSRKVLVTVAILGAAGVSALIAATPTTQHVEPSVDDEMPESIIATPPDDTAAPTTNIAPLTANTDTPIADRARTVIRPLAQLKQKNTMVFFGHIKWGDKRTIIADHEILIPPQSTLPYSVDFEVGASHFLPDDNIIITEVRGTNVRMAAGNIYCIRGAFSLASHERAVLAAFTTGKPANSSTPTLQVQTALIHKGDGYFTLYFPMAADGSPHISFYPIDGGENFGSAYFGTADTPTK